MACAYISISGNIGVGKSTFSRKLSATLGLQHYPEPVTNPYLADYYRDPHRWGLHSQVQFALDYAAVHRAITAGPAAACQDRSLYESLVFARALASAGILSAREFATLTRLIDHCLAGTQPPDLLVYLHAPIPVLLQRIGERGLGCERVIDAAYLGHLQAAYDEWIAGFRICPVLSLDTVAHDLAHDPSCIREVCAQVGALAGVRS